MPYKQCCGTGTAGTVTFSLRGTGMHSDSGSSSGTGFGSGSIIKWNTKVNFLVNNAVSNIEKARFCTNLFSNCAKYCLDPESEPEPKLYFTKDGTGDSTTQHKKLLTNSPFLC